MKIDKPKDSERKFSKIHKYPLANVYARILAWRTRPDGTQELSSAGEEGQLTKNAMSTAGTVDTDIK